MIKGYPSQGKHLAMENVAGSANQSLFVTLQKILGERLGLDVLNHGAYRAGSAIAVASDTATSTNRLINATSHGALEGDYIRWETGNNVGIECPVIKVVDADNLVISNLLSTLPLTGETFYVMRYVTPRYDSSGLISATISGGATEAKQDDIITELVAIKNGVGQGEPKEIIYNDYSSTPVTSAAYVELVASTGADFTKLKIFDSSGYPWYLALGASGSEVDEMLVPPGGFEEISVNIPSGTRISAKALSTSLSSGEVIINALGAV